MDFIFQFAHGLLQLPWWGYVLVTLALTRITIAGVTIYLHRHSGPPGPGPASDRQPLLPLLAVAHYGHGHQGVGRRASQAPRQGARPPRTRTARRSSGLRKVLLEGVGAVSHRLCGHRIHRQVRSWDARRLAGAQSLFAPPGAGCGADDGDRPGAVRRAGAGRVGRADGLDPVLRRRHYQRRRSLFRIPHLPGGRRQHQHRAMGNPDRR